LLANAKLRPVDLERLSGISINTINSLRKGKPAKIDTILKIANVLKTSSDIIAKPSKTNSRLSERTILHYHRLISEILKSARFPDKLITSNPAEFIDAPKAKKPHIIYLSKAECDTLLDYLQNENEQFKTIIILAIFSGMRRQELMGLQWNDIQLVNIGKRQYCAINVQRASNYTKEKGIYTAPLKSEDSYRIIKVPAAIFRYLDKVYKKWQENNKLNWIEKRHNWVDTDRLFIQKDGSPMHPDTPTKWFNEFMRSHPDLPKACLHGLRHSHASIEIENGVNVAAISARLGHSNIATTLNVYTHAFSSGDIIASNTLEDLFNDSLDALVSEKPDTSEDS
jgi:integrase